MTIHVFSLIMTSAAWLLVAFTLWPLARLMMPARRQKKLAEPSAPSAPDVTVIVLTDSNHEGLINVIAALKSQDYPGKTNIIITCDPTSRLLSETVKQILHNNPDIYATYVPEETRNVSRRKLAIYLGVKGSKTDRVVLVTSDTKIMSNRWLLTVMDCFDDRTDIVVSPVRPVAFPGKGFRKGLRVLDFVLTNLTWLSAALAGKCFRGDSHNLAYRQKSFFDNKGFSKSLNFHYGDDDIFINEISKRGRVGVNLFPDGLCETVALDSFVYERMSRHRLFTTRGLGAGARRLTSSLSLVGWAILACIALGVIFAQGNLLFLILAPMSIVGYCVLTGLGLSRAARFLRIPVPAATVGPALLMRPFLTLRRLLKLRKEKDINYSWKKLK